MNQGNPSGWSYAARHFPLETSTRRALRGMATLATGSGAAKLIGLASLPVITRLYSPADVGALSVFAGLLMLLAPLLTLQYNRALPVPRSDAAAANLLVLCLVLVLGLWAILWFVLSVAAGPLLTLLSMETLLPFWWMLPLGATVMALYSTLQLWATRRRQYRLMAGAEVAQSAAGNGAKIALAFVLVPPLGLILGHVLAQGAGVVMLIMRFRAEFGRLSRHVRPRRLRTIAWRYRAFPAFRLPSQLALLLSSQAPVIFIAGNFGAATAGQFGLAMMALAMPMNLIGGNMGKAYFGEAAHLGRNNPEALRRSLFGVTRILGGVGIVLTAALIMAAPSLFPLVFGAQWVEAGQFAAVLAIFLTFQFVAAPVMNVLSVLGREEVYLRLDLQRLAIMVVLFVTAYLTGLPALQTVLLYSLLMALHYMICFACVLRAIPVLGQRGHPA